MNLFHTQKGELTPAGKKYSPIGNKIVPLYSDKNGKKHELDGTEMPLDAVLKFYDKIKAEEEAKVGEEKQAEEDDVLASLDEMERLGKKALKEEEKYRMHSEVLDKIESAPDAIVEAIKGIPETVVPEYPDHSKEYNKWKDEVVRAIEGIKIPETDLSSVINAIDGIKFPEHKENDYTLLLREIKNAIQPADMSPVVDALNPMRALIEQIDIPTFKFNKSGRLKIEVDQMAVAVGSGANQDPLASYKSAGMDLSSDPMYFGFLRADGFWYIKCLDIASGTTYAKGDSGYTTAWTGRAGLSYDEFNNVF